MPMSTYVERFVEHIQEAEHELALEAAAQQRRWHYRMHRGRVWFDHEAREAQRRLKQGILQFLWQGSFFNLVTAPAIYSLLVPRLVLDAWVTPYQWTCFPIYGVARVRRRRYGVFDLAPLRRALCREPARGGRNHAAAVRRRR